MGNNPSKKGKKGKNNTNKPEESSSSSSSYSAPSHTLSSSSNNNNISKVATEGRPSVASSPSSSVNSAKVDSTHSMSKSSSKVISPKLDADRHNFSQKRLEDMFEKYKESDSQIGPEGIEALCKDIGVEPEDVVVLVLAWHLNAQSMGYFKKDEFMTGLQSLGVDTVDKLKANLNNFKTELDDPGKYKDIYRFAFGFAKEKEQKILDLATADAMLDLVLGERFPHTEKLRQFLKEQTSYKSINFDQWMNILEFSRTIKGDLSNYDENGAWPVLLDEYCEWAREKR